MRKLTEKTRGCLRGVGNKKEFRPLRRRAGRRRGGFVTHKNSRGWSTGGRVNSYTYVHLLRPRADPVRAVR